MQDFDFDCLVIGGGPAGLTAAIYLTRYHLSLKVVDAGKSRAGWIPCTHNHAGFPGGISGTELLERMREQAQMYGASIERARVTRLAPIEGGFEAEWGQGCVTARKVLLATGLTNRRPQVDPDLHDTAMAQGLIRYCPVCDGYEVTDKTVAVVGSGPGGVGEATFLRGYTEDVTLIGSDGPVAIDGEARARLDDLRIRILDGPCEVRKIRDGQILVTTPAGEHMFDSVYPALGSDTHTELAQQAGVALTPGGTIPVDDHQRTNVPGLYAAGDVVLGLDQISHAMGEGGVAATTIRNDLSHERPILRENLRGNSMR